MLALVDLTPLRDSLVGLPGISGLSVEQRKRLTIAVELVGACICSTSIAGQAGLWGILNASPLPRSWWAVCSLATPLKAERNVRLATAGEQPASAAAVFGFKDIMAVA